MFDLFTQQFIFFFFFAFQTHHKIRIYLLSFCNCKSFDSNLIFLFDCNHKLPYGCVPLKWSNSPSLPDVGLQVFMHFNLLDWSWFSHSKRRYCEIEERIPHEIQGTGSKVLDKLDGLECSYTAGGGGEGRHDPTSLEFDSQPIHGLKFVVACSQVG